MCKKDGTAFWAHIESTISKDSQGLLVCNIAIIDISILKREEGELKESEKKYKSLFESARNAILSTAELRRKAEERVLMESSIKPSFDMDKDVFHELHIHKIELEIQNEELINAQISLDISSSKYLKLYEHAPVGYSVIDENGTFLEVNIMAKMLLGIDSETINKYSITNFITYENQDIYYLHRKHLFETFESQSYELKMLKKNGVSFWAHIEASISKNEKDEFICYLVIIDISKFKCIELKLREYIGQLKKDTS
jgi:PAS domain S-box-containing protein